MFNMIKTIISPHIEPPPIAPEVANSSGISIVAIAELWATLETKNIANFEPQPAIEGKTKEEENTVQNREELDGRRPAAVKYAQKYPAAPLRFIEKKFGLGQKTLSRSPYKEMIAKFAENRFSVPSKGTKTSCLEKKEKISKSVSQQIPDHRKSHVDEVDDRLDGINET